MNLVRYRKITVVHLYIQLSKTAKVWLIRNMFTYFKYTCFKKEKNALKFTHLFWMYIYYGGLLKTMYSKYLIISYTAMYVQSGVWMMTFNQKFVIKKNLNTCNKYVCNKISKHSPSNNTFCRSVWHWNLYGRWMLWRESWPMI